MNTVTRLLRLLAPFRWWIALAITLNFATIGASVGLMAMAAYLIAKAALVTSVADLAIATAFVRLFALSRAGLRYSERYTTHTVTFRVLAQLRTWFYSAIEPLAPARLMRYRSGDLFARIGADIETLQDFYVRVVVPPIAAALAAALACAILGSFNMWLGVALLVFLLLTGVALPLATRWLSRPQATQLTSTRAALHTLIADGLLGDADLLAFGQAEAQMQRIATLGDDLNRAQERLAMLRGLGLALAALFTGLASVTVLAIAIPLVTSGRLEGVFLALLPLTAIASFEAVQPLALAFQQLETSRAAAARLFELIDAPPEIVNPTRPAPPPIHYAIEVRDLRFRYAPDQPRLFDGLSFHVPAGGRLTISGPSGAGKTTLVNLLLRFWEYHDGQILIGGRDIRTLEAEQTRALFSVVAQQNYLFNSTIRDNLLLARADATDAELMDACREAQLADFITDQPHGLDTLVGENGMRLSGGERQRIALARAMLKDAPILILDEATESLDPVTAARVRQALDRFAAGRTTLIFAHETHEQAPIQLPARA